MPTIPAEVYGPAGLLVFLVYAVWRLWKLHEAEDIRRNTLLETLTSQLPDLIASNKLMSATIAERLSQAEAPPVRSDRATLTFTARKREREGEQA